MKTRKDRRAAEQRRLYEQRKRQLRKQRKDYALRDVIISGTAARSEAGLQP